MFKNGPISIKSAVVQEKKKFDGPLLLDLESAEAKALAGYTDEDYETINKELRDGILSEKTVEKTAYIKAALDQLPSHKGVVYRGNHSKVLEWHDFSVGSIFCDPAFLSTSLLESVCDYFSTQEGSAGNGVLFVIKCKGKSAGKYISRYAIEEHQGEEEVLFPPGTKFRITKVEKGKKVEICKVWMEEMEDDEPSKPAAVDGDDSTAPSPEVPLPVEIDPPAAVEEEEVTTPAAAAAPVPLVTPPRVDSALDGGSVWINGRRRSPRHQPQLGSVFVNGLRRSARLR